MNKAQIPDASDICRIQIAGFKSLYNINASHKKHAMRKKLVLDANELKQINTIMQNETVAMIKSFEQNVDKIFSSIATIKKFQKDTKTDHTANILKEESSLRNSIQSMSKTLNDIVQQKRVQSTDQYIEQLQNNLNKIQQALSKQAPSLVLLDSNLFQTAKGENTSFMHQLGYLSNHIKGISLLEREGVLFFKELVESSFPEDFIVVGNGQWNVGGKNPSQDALIFEKDAQVRLLDGTKKPIMEWLNDLEKRSGTKKISMSNIEYLNLLAQALGVQAKYHRGGYITMASNITLADVIDNAPALRNLYILYRGFEGYKGENVSHKFNVKATHKDYKALFSYEIGKIMDRVINENYYMITAKGITDSYTYFLDLLNKQKYFAPIGNVSLYPINKKYRIAIKET